MLRCGIFLLIAAFPFCPAWAEDGSAVIGRLNASLGYSATQTSDLEVNAALISKPGLVVGHALDFATRGGALINLESEFRLLQFASPASAALIQDRTVTTSFRGSFGWRILGSEIGIVAGTNQSALVGAPPDLLNVSVQNVFQVQGGLRLALNIRASSAIYLRLEGSYLWDLPAVSDDGQLRVARGTQINAVAHLGLGRFKDRVRLLGGFSLHEMGTSLGRQKAMTFHIGLSIGDIFGTRPPSGR